MRFSDVTFLEVEEVEEQHAIERAALQVCVAFLRLNGLDVTLDTHPWHAHVLDVAIGVLDVQQVTALLVAEMGGDVDIEAD